jgi:hypothetical protein
MSIGSTLTREALGNRQRRRVSKRENDAYSREMTVVRAAEKRRRRIRNRIIGFGVLAVIALAAVAGLVWVIWLR